MIGDIVRYAEYPQVIEIAPRYHSSDVLPRSSLPQWHYLPVQTGANQATGLTGLPPAASPPPAFHTRTKKNLLVESWIVGLQVTEKAGVGV